MDAGTFSIRDIFSYERRHVVPVFQRPYVWNETDQWAPLWEDVRGVAERQLSDQEVWPHFLGAVVLDPVQVPYGRLQTLLIIDGQQRLTTIQILLEAVADVCADVGLAAYQKALTKLTRNDDPLSQDPDEQFKVWPTTVDQKHFRRVMLADTPDQLATEYKKAKERSRLRDPLPSAYRFFFEEAKQWITADPAALETRAAALVAAVRDHLRIVVIQLKSGDDAQMIFETLNARGTPLLATDLIKNHVFHEAGRCGIKADELYEKYWKAFDDEAAYWRQEIGRGHAKRPRVDAFIHAFLTVRAQDTVPVTHLYTVFKNSFSGHENADPLEFTRAIRRHADLYLAIDRRAEPELRPYLDRLDTMGITTAYPFLLGLWEKTDGESEYVVPALATLESFLVRRLICQLSTRGYNNLFVGLLDTLAGPVAELETRVAARLLAGEGETNRWPDDAEFAAAFASIPAYRVMARPRVNMILRAIEKSLFNPKSEKVDTSELTIEHLMPQEWKAFWNLPEGLEPAAAAALRNQVLHRFGNLTLVTGKLNPAIGNGKWTAKIQEILKNSRLELNLEFEHRKDEHERAWKAVWDEAMIDQRGHLLASRAVAVWPRPKKTEQAESA